MKKINPSYLATHVGLPALLVVVLLGAALIARGAMSSPIVFVVLICVAFALIVAIPVGLDSELKKRAVALEKDFPAKGFTYQYKFEAGNAVYYIDQGGRMGVVYRFNPTELQFVDLNKVTNVYTNSGQFGAGTSRVCCEFQLDGKKVRINTLTVSRGSLSMKDKRVLEAISKADQIGVMMNTAKANAKT